MEKAVVLNSGGFDSTVLLADLSSRGIYDLYSMYFSYGQPNDDLGKTIAKENAEKLGANHIEVNLPEFSWSKSSFYDKDLNDFNGQYLEMRNMVFISYALSYAQSVGADSIYMALLNGCVYADCTDYFLDCINGICNFVFVNFNIPYRNCSKQELFPLAKSLGVGDSLKFISCDTPHNGIPCGKCVDCKDINEYKNFIKNEK